MNFKNKYFWIFFSALLAIFSHPTVIFGYPLPEMGWLAFLAYTPLFYFVCKKEKSKNFKKSFCFGFLFYFGALYWIYNALNGYGHIPALAAFFALFVLVVILSLYLSLIFIFSKWIENNTSISCFWTLPVLWVAAEWCRSHWPLGGLSWCQVGYSQWKFLTFIQISDLLGIYGVTALVIWINLALLEIFYLLQKKAFQKKSVFRILFVFILTLFTLFYGVSQKSKVESISNQSPHFKIALLQGNIPQDEKWLLEKSDEILNIYQEMTHAAFNQYQPDIVIWPEASFPYEIAIDKQENIDFIGNFPGDVLLGAVSYENKGLLPPETLFTPIGFPIYNSALLIKPGSKLAGTYSKHHLVPYGEYVPLRSILPYIEKLTSEMGEFLPGIEYNLLESGSAKMGLLICYEDIFPEIAQQLVKNGANLLVNITNDAWYGDSSALPQHLSFSAFRSIENRRSLVRATNTGITASFDSVGKLRALAPSFERKIAFDQVSLIDIKSFYSKHGDLFAYACLAISGILIVLTLFKKSTNRES